MHRFIIVLLMRDYQLLVNTYAANARLFHDFHNHIEALHRYLEKDRTAEAVQYLESLRSPIEAVTQSVWVGDEVVDYLINSKITIAASREILVNCNIEYPQHTNIRRLLKQIKHCMAGDFKAFEPLLNAMTELSKQSTAIIHSALLPHYLLKQ